MKNPFRKACSFVRVATVSPQTRPADIANNIARILEAADDAVDQGATIIVYPELCITGYTCGDVFTLPSLLEAASTALVDVMEWTQTSEKPATLVVGLPVLVDSHLYNMAAVVHDGRVLGLVPKIALPNAHEYYDARWFTSGSNLRRTEVDLGFGAIPCGTDLVFADSEDPRLVMAIEVCEDLWSAMPPSGWLAVSGATVIVNPSASTELVGKAAYRRTLVQQQSARTYSAYVYTSAGVGESTTDVVYGGHQIIAEAGEILAESGRLLRERVVTVADIDLDRVVSARLDATSWRQEPVRAVRRIAVDFALDQPPTVARPVRRRPFVPTAPDERRQVAEDVMRIQTIGLAIRAERARARRLVIGVSGGLDSTLALLVCNAVAQEMDGDVTTLAVTMPGPGTTDRTLQNARALCSALGIELREIPIGPAVEQHLRDIGHRGHHDITFENAQARERTQILMDLANMEGGIVVGTGDLSELALGWCTYNADHMSMYGVNAGVPKTLVRHIIEEVGKADEALRAVLADIVETPVSPELLPPTTSGIIAQRTEEVLGPYELHDFFLYHVVRLKLPAATVLTLAVEAFGKDFRPQQIARYYRTFVTRFFSQQFKRSSMPDSVKVGTVALSPRADWRMPSDASAAVWLEELDELLAQCNVQR